MHDESVSRRIETIYPALVQRLSLKYQKGIMHAYPTVTPFAPKSDQKTYHPPYVCVIYRRWYSRPPGQSLGW